METTRGDEERTGGDEERTGEERRGQHGRQERAGGDHRRAALASCVEAAAGVAVPVAAESAVAGNPIHNCCK
jgi:hypothetical protein